MNKHVESYKNMSSWVRPVELYLGGENVLRWHWSKKLHGPCLGFPGHRALWISRVILRWSWNGRQPGCDFSGILGCKALRRVIPRRWSWNGKPINGDTGGETLHGYCLGLFGKISFSLQSYNQEIILEW